MARPLAIAIPALLAAAAGPAQAQEIKYETGVSVLRSDNIAMSETAPMDETVLSPFLRFEADHEGSSLRLKARGRVEYLGYVDHSYDDEWRGELAAQVNWALAPERVEVVVNEWLILAPIDVFTSFVPTNQQQVNVFQAGPSFFARFSPSTQGQVDLRYVNTRAEDTKEFNGDRFKAAARLIRAFNPATTGSINLEATRVQFDRDSGSTDYTRYGADLGLSRQLAALNLEADLGAARISRKGSRDTSAPTVRLRADWRVTPRSTLSAAADHELGDAAQYTAVDIRDEIKPILDGLTNADLAAGPSLFKHRRVELYYRFSGERLSLQLHPRHQEFRYLEDAIHDQRIRGGVVELGYQLRGNMTFALSAERLDRRFDAIDRRDRDSRYLLTLMHEFARNWTWRIDFERQRRDSSTAFLSHDVNAVSLTIAYRR